MNLESFKSATLRMFPVSVPWRTFPPLLWNFTDNELRKQCLFLLENDTFLSILFLLFLYVQFLLPATKYCNDRNILKFKIDNEINDKGLFNDVFCFDAVSLLFGKRDTEVCKLYLTFRQFSYVYLLFSLLAFLSFPYDYRKSLLVHRVRAKPNFRYMACWSLVSRNARRK